MQYFPNFFQNIESLVLAINDFLHVYILLICCCLIAWCYSLTCYQARHLTRRHLYNNLRKSNLLFPTSCIILKCKHLDDAVHIGQWRNFTLILLKDCNSLIVLDVFPFSTSSKFLLGAIYELVILISLNFCTFCTVV